MVVNILATRIQFVRNGSVVTFDAMDLLSARVDMMPVLTPPLREPRYRVLLRLTEEAAVSFRTNTEFDLVNGNEYPIDLWGPVINKPKWRNSIDGANECLAEVLPLIRKRYISGITTVNGEESGTPTITVEQGGSPVGTLNPVTGVVTVPQCPPPVCDDAEWTLKNASDTVLNTGSIPSGESAEIEAPDGGVYATDGITHVADVPSGDSIRLPKSRIKYRDATDTPTATDPSDTEFGESFLHPATEVPRRELKDSGGIGLGLYVTLDRLLADTVPAAPDAGISVDGTPATTVKSGGALDVQLVDENADPVTPTSVDTSTPGVLKIEVPAGGGPQTIAFEFTAFTDYILLTVRASAAGTYTATTDDGSSGTIEFNINGGGWGAFSNPTTLDALDVIEVHRSTIGAAGWVEITGT